MLLVSLGDGGSGGDPRGNGQSLSTLLGKILRIDIEHGTTGQPYPAASFVWSVERTRCPVRAACVAISAVSLSRISPTSITSGS